MIHTLTSSLIFWRTPKFVDSARWKILAFLSFQISQQIRMIIDRRPLLFTLGTSDMAVHHPSRVSLGGQAFGCKLWFAVQKAISLHRRFVNLQSLKRCKLVSTCSLHRGQILWFGQFRACNLSTVQIRFCMASQLKNLH